MIVLEVTSEFLLQLIGDQKKPGGKFPSSRPRGKSDGRRRRARCSAVISLGQNASGCAHCWQGSRGSATQGAHRSCKEGENQYRAQKSRRATCATPAERNLARGMVPR